MYFLLRQLLLSFFCWSFHFLLFELGLEGLGNREAAAVLDFLLYQSYKMF